MTTPVHFHPKNIPGLLRGTVARTPERRFLRSIDPAAPDAPPQEMTYAEFERLVRRAAACLREAGVGAGDRVLVLGENSAPWQVFAIAAQALRAEAAAPFANLDGAQVQDIARRVRPKAVFVSTGDQWKKLEPCVREIAALKTLVTPDEKLEAGGGIATLRWRDVAARAPLGDEEYAKLVEAVKPEDPFILIFTSGTTGRQKGVRVPQRGIVAAVEAGAEACGVGTDDGLCFLPFAHIAAQVEFNVAIATGSSLVLAARRDDIQRGFALGPTFVLSVPLIYERIWNGVLALVRDKPAPLAALLDAAVSASGRASLGPWPGYVDWLLAHVARFLVGTKLKQKLGGNIRFVCGGGAPSHPDMVKFFRGLGIEYLEVYGMSETSGIISINRRGDRTFKLGSSGRPWRDVEVRIADDGEVQVRGALLMTGYLEKEDEADCYTADGFFRTGDLGRLDADGYLFITGRKKHLFVLSTGKKLSPEPIEQRMASAPPVAGAVLLGDGEAFLSAGLFVAKEDLEKARAAGGKLEDRLLEGVREQLGGFAEYEQPKKVFVIEGAPADHPDVLTPTLKVKREVFAKKFRSEIEAIYGRAQAGVAQLK